MKRQIEPLLDDGSLLGDLVVAAFDEAARGSENPQEVSRLAMQMVARALLRARRAVGGQAADHAAQS